MFKYFPVLRNKSSMQMEKLKISLPYLWHRHGPSFPFLSASALGWNGYSFSILNPLLALQKCKSLVFYVLVVLEYESFYSTDPIKMRVKFRSRLKWNGNSLGLTTCTIIACPLISLKILKRVSMNGELDFECQLCRVHLCLLWHSVARKMTWHAREMIL